MNTNKQEWWAYNPHEEIRERQLPDGSFEEVTVLHDPQEELAVAYCDEQIERLGYIPVEGL